MTISFPYLFLIPDYNRVSGGIRVAHSLIHMLNERGYEAYSVTPVVNPDWNEKYANDKMQRELIRHGVVVYPEIVYGNPFRAKRVVRYVMNVPGLLGGYTTYPPDEVLFGHNKFLRSYVPSDDRILEIPSIETEIFNNDNPQPRHGGCYYLGKSINLGIKMVPQTRGLIEISRENGGWPKTRKELAQLLKSSEIFYCYDNFTGLANEARMCGCPTVLVYPRPGGKQEYLDKDYSIDGLAFGLEKAEIDRARATIQYFHDWYMQAISVVDKQLANFILITQSKDSYENHAFPEKSQVQGYYHSVVEQTLDQFSYFRHNSKLSSEMTSEISYSISLFQRKLEGAQPNIDRGEFGIINRLVQDEKEPNVRIDYLMQIMALYLSLNGLNERLRGNLELGDFLLKLAGYAKVISPQIKEIELPLFETGSNSIGKQEYPDGVNREPQKQEVIEKSDSLSEANLVQPAQTLERMLESEDLLAALEMNKHLLDGDLLSLVKKNILEARKDNEMDLVEGLEYLANYIENIIMQR